MTSKTVRHLEAQQALRDMIEAAVAEANRGVFVSEAAMHRWMDIGTRTGKCPSQSPPSFLAGE